MVENIGGRPDERLLDLVAECHLSLSKRDLSALGRKLADSIGRISPYSYKHLHGIARGSMRPGRDLSRAIDTLLASEDGGHKGIGYRKRTISGAQVPPLEDRRCIECMDLFTPNVRNRYRCYVCSPMRER